MPRSHPAAALSPEPLKRRSLLSPAQLCKAYPAIKPRTLKYWLQHAPDRHVSQSGNKRTIPGNGLGAAIVRKGRLVFIDEELFLQWLYDRNIGETR